MWDHMQKSRREFQTEIFEAFKAYDVNNRGSITMKDLRHIMLRTGEKLTPQECKQYSVVINQFMRSIQKNILTVVLFISFEGKT